MVVVSWLSKISVILPCDAVDIKPGKLFLALAKRRQRKILLVHSLTNRQTGLHLHIIFCCIVPERVAATLTSQVPLSRCQHPHMPLCLLQIPTASLASLSDVPQLGFFPNVATGAGA